MNKGKKLLSLVKIGQKEYIENLLNKGELYLNSIDYYKTSDNKEIGDCWENLFRLEHGKISIYDENNEKWVALHSSDESIRFRDLLVCKNIYCMYGIFLENFIDEKEYKFYDFSSQLINDFGGTVLYINEPLIFFERIRNALRKKNLESCIDSVTYYNENRYNGSLDEFRKRDKYSHQNEVRVSVKNIKKTPLLLNIGPITDIAVIVTDKRVKRVCENSKDLILKFYK